MRFEAGIEDQGTRLDLFLTRFFPELTRSGVHTVNRRGGIRVNGDRKKAGYRLRPGDVVEVDPPEAVPSTLEPEEIPLEVVYEDDVLAVIDKPAGMVVHPGAGNWSGTLANALSARFPGLSNTGGSFRPGIVHRLDKWTSGLIIVAKTNTAHSHLSRSFQEREVRKVYTAVVHGRLRALEGSVDLSIGRHPAARTRMAVTPGVGRTAYSEYAVIEVGTSPFSLIRVRIRTGRTHQIRVHLSAIGHPVVGDSTYGESTHRAFVKKYGKLNRYFLHASELELPHPVTGIRMAFDSPLPKELSELWSRLKIDG